MPVSAKKRISNDAFNAKCGRVEIRPQKPIVTDIRSAASDAGQSLQGYILQAVRERMARDGFSPASDLWPDYNAKG